MPNDETPQTQEVAGSAANAPAEGAGEGAAPEPAFQPPVSKLAQAIVELQASSRDQRDRMLRVAADFDNFKKRSRKEQQDALRRAEEKLVLEFLPVLDNLERALSHVEGDAGGLAEGVRMVQKQFLAVLEKLEIRPFDSVGQAFDPERHEALQQVHAEAPAGTIAQQLQRGYVRGEKLVRPALVVVSLGPAPATPAAAPESGAAGEPDAKGEG